MRLLVANERVQSQFRHKSSESFVRFRTQKLDGELRYYSDGPALFRTHSIKGRQQGQRRCEQIESAPRALKYGPNPVGYDYVLAWGFLA
jgi:hypothetical protein